MGTTNTNGNNGNQTSHHYTNIKMNFPTFFDNFYYPPQTTTTVFYNTQFYLYASSWRRKELAHQEPSEPQHSYMPPAL